MMLLLFLFVWSLSVWGYLWWLPGDVYTVWLCYTFLLSIPSSGSMCTAE